MNPLSLMLSPRICWSSRLPALLAAGLLGLGSFGFGGVAAYAQGVSCEKAWAEYNEFRKRNTMEESQYPLTLQGAAVRAACGADALPAPPGSDVNMYRPRVVRPVVPTMPLNPPGTPAAPVPSGVQVKPASSPGVFPKAN